MIILTVCSYHVTYAFQSESRGGFRINFRMLQNFTKKTEHRNDVIYRKIIYSARSKKVQL